MRTTAKTKQREVIEYKSHKKNTISIYTVTIYLLYSINKRLDSFKLENISVLLLLNMIIF